MMRYTIKRGGEARWVQIQALEDGLFDVQVEGEPTRRVRMTRSGGRLHLLEGADSHLVEISGERGARYAAIDGVHAALEVYDDAALRRLRAREGLSGGDEIIASPMPGRVVQILVTEGQAVQAGQAVAIVEAMKMENELRAQINGVVQAIYATEGMQVDGKTPLIMLEPTT